VERVNTITELDTLAAAAANPTDANLRSEESQVLSV
jgi:hypothetical protein